MKENLSVPSDGRWKYRELLLSADPEEQAIDMMNGRLWQTADSAPICIVCG